MKSTSFLATLKHEDMFPSLLLLGLLAVPCISWTSEAYLDLAWPPRWTLPPGDRYMMENGIFLSPNYLNSCLNLPVPTNASRTLFPATGGHFLFNQVNKTGPPGQKYVAELYFSFISPQVTSIMRFQRMGPWQDFQTGSNCSVPINASTLLLGLDGKPATVAEMVGTNLTIALAMHMSVYDASKTVYVPWDEVHEVFLQSI